jgi:radical SAM superfamily enzyme YgiQ (UPF0313 family)
MNILLIYPEMPRTIGKFEHMANLAGRKSAFPPIGLLTVAAMLPNEWNKKVVDLNTDPLTEEDLNWADYAFISAMNVQAKSSKEVVEICNKANLPVVAGGPLFTHEYEKFPGVSHFILNEAELTLPPFLNDLKNGEAKRIYSSEKFADTHTTPPPMWELVDVNKYLYAVIQYSRGCPYLCDFCDVTALFGRVPRTKTVEQILSELDTLMSAGKNEMIFFADDNLIGNKNRLKKELLPALIEWRSRNKYAPAFATQLTINIVDDENLMQLMLEAGFRHILIGIESIDEASLIQMKKKQNSKRNILENMKYLQARGFVVIGTFIVGLDTDGPDVFQNVINFIQESGIVLVVVNVLKAPPGTELYDRMVKEKRLLEDFEFDEDRTNIIPIMDPDQLHEGYKKVLQNVYSPESVYKRVVKFYETKEPYKVKYPLNRKVNLKDIYNFLRIIANLGFIDKNRKYFWKMIAFTAKYNVNYIDLTVLYALLMHQYQILLDGFLEREKKGILIYSDKLKSKQALSA